MEDYNALISAKILDSYEAMLDTTPQPTMFGGKRMRNFVLPGSTDYDYPGSLSVGRMDGQHPQTLSEDFYRDFGDGFPTGSLQGSGYSGGAVYIGKDGMPHSTGVLPPRRIGGKKFNFGKAMKSVGKELAPVGKELGTTLLKEGAKEGIKQMLKPQNVEMMAEEAPMVAMGRRRGGKKFNLGKALKPVAPIAKELGMTLAKEGIKEGVKSYAKGGRRKKGVLHSVGKALKSVGKELLPVAKDVFHDVIVPEGKKALREYIKESLKSRPSSDPNNIPTAYAEPVGNGRKARGRPKKMMGADPRTYTPQHLLAQGGALIRNDPSQFHSSVYPPALASYTASLPRGQDAYGRGRAKLPASGAKRNSARGAIVAEVMKKHGLTLAQASKFVKEKGLY